MKKRTIFYATRSPFKKQELEIISANETFTDAAGEPRKIGSAIDFKVSDIETEEPLEISLVEMVRHKARSAYKKILAPCIVEHAGLILETNSKAGFPGGLTQPMWDALGPEGFLSRLGCAGERATARAVVGYCDGAQTRTFVGETRGTIVTEPHGAREFYWDVVFSPDGGGGKTYAQIAAEKGGLAQKLALSQSTMALKAFAAFLSSQTGDSLFYIA
jgi:XTP/dITP diphosphohydrolase